MKKTVLSLAIAIALTLFLSGNTFAGHHDHGVMRVIDEIDYEICGQEDCNLSYAHQHDGKYYYGHELLDGHSHHQLCTVKDCTITVSHTHDGKVYFGHSINDGRTYHDDRHHSNYGRSSRYHH